MERSSVSSADGFIPAAFDVTGALQPTHTHTLVALLMDSPVCCHGLFREVSLEARPPAHIVDVVPVASHDGRAGALTLRVETTGGVEVHAALINEAERGEVVVRGRRPRMRSLMFEAWM